MATPPVPSCLSCPSFLNPEDAAASLGKSTAAPMCARFGFVLGRPGATNKQNTETAELRAKGCSKYGQPRPAGTLKNAAIATEVCIPDVAVRVELPVTDPNRTSVRGCAQCKNFIPDKVVKDETGWVGGICAARGRLILGSRKVAEGQNCEYRAIGSPRTTMDLPLLPIYSSATTAEEAALKKAGLEIIEPLEYVSDRTVTPEEEAQGIKAWRLLKDPNGSNNTVYLPVFRPDIFTDAELDLIPKTGSREHPELYLDYGGYAYQIAILWMELDETPAAWGMPGVGKTEIARHLAWMMQLPFYRFSIKEATELYELEGSTQFEEGKGTYFRDGRFTTAWGSKCVLIVDEPNMGRPEVWAFLRPCMDNSKALVLDSDGGRTIQRGEFCFPMLSMNPAWSPLNIGTAPIGAADASRMMHLDFDLPPEEVERKIIKSWVMQDGWMIDDQRLSLVLKASAMIRELCNNGTIALSWGLRETIKVSRSLRFFDPTTAFKISAANYLEPQQRQTLLDQVRAAGPGTSLPPIKMIDPPITITPSNGV